MLYSSTTTAENGNNLIIELYTITSIKKICEYQLLSESLQEKNAKNVHRLCNGALYYKKYHTKIYTYWYAKGSRILASAPTTAPFHINIQVQCWFIAVDLKNKKQRLLILDLFALSFLPFMFWVFLRYLEGFSSLEC